MFTSFSPSPGNLVWRHLDGRRNYVATSITSPEQVATLCVKTDFSPQEERATIYMGLSERDSKMERLIVEVDGFNKRVLKELAPGRDTFEGFERLKLMKNVY